jgi:hypothetical protein
MQELVIRYIAASSQNGIYEAVAVTGHCFLHELMLDQVLFIVRYGPANVSEIQNREYIKFGLL